MINIQIRGDRELIARFDALPEKMRHALKAKTQTLAYALQRKVVSEKLSGQVLKRVTGALARSIDQRVEEQGSAVKGFVFSSGDVKYAGIHEFGGKTPPHVILPVKAKALAFMMGGKQVFAKRVNHPGSQMPERSFMRSSLADMRGEIVEGLTQAVKEATRQ